MIFIAMIDFDDMWKKNPDNVVICRILFRTGKCTPFWVYVWYVTGYVHTEAMHALSILLKLPLHLWVSPSIYSVDNLLIQQTRKPFLKGKLPTCQLMYGYQNMHTCVVHMWDGGGGVPGPSFQQSFPAGPMGESHVTYPIMHLMLPVCSPVQHGKGHITPSLPWIEFNRLTDRQTRLKTLPSHKLRMRAVIKNLGLICQS